MGLLINCYFQFEVQLFCLSLDIEVLSFEDSEWSCGRWKVECQVEKLKHFRHILLFDSIEGRIQRTRPETFAPCMGTMPSERARQENGFLVLMRIISKLVTIHGQEDPKDLMKIV